MHKLTSLLTQIDAKGYKAYKQLAGAYQYPDFELYIDHVQGDPFADASRCHVRLTAATVNLPIALFSNSTRRIALEDYLGRRFSGAIKQIAKGDRGSGKSGEISMVAYGQQVLQRNAVLVDKGAVEVRFQLALPASGRRISASQAKAMLLEELPKIVTTALVDLSDSYSAICAHVDSIEDQHLLRQQLHDRGLVAFIADKSVLPRASGIDDRPLPKAIEFLAPDSMATTLQTNSGQPVRGMGIPKGVTLIVGGGFHGKSTLLQAIECGVYDHIPGDGRERVVTDAQAMKIRAEDGRAITAVDISPFINNLPQGKNTRCFSTQNASGSTSQAASIMEALATGSQTLLIDEDTSATNFMIRDKLMQALVQEDKEPITPLIQRIRQLHTEKGISVIMVMGGSGDFFATADKVIMMDNYVAKDVTGRAKTLTAKHSVESAKSTAIPAAPIRVADSSSISAKDHRHRDKIQAYDTRALRYGNVEIDVARVEQLIDPGQLLAIGYLLRLSSQFESIDEMDITEVLQKILLQVERRGLDDITPYTIGTLALPRLQELAATLNRLRSLIIKKDTSQLSPKRPD